MKEFKDQSYLGIGWSFPPNFNSHSKEIIMSVSQEDIEQSLEILLSTRPGERVMQPSYGCNLDIMLFEPLTVTLITYIKDLVRKAILFYEARIDANRIDVSADSVNDGIILIEVDYTIRSTNSRFNFVYPFYLEEATNLSNSK